MSSPALPDALPFEMAGMMHDFANRSDTRMGLFIVFAPEGFEENMPGIVKWFEENSGTKG